MPKSQPKLNEAQKKAAEAPQGPLLIVAGAGTGKTHTLTHRLIHLVNEGVAPERICAITFTNKAAKEMAERVADGGWRRADGRNNCSPFAVGHQPFIGTFHSLGARILRSEARLVKRKPNFVIFDADDSLSLIKKITKEYTKGERGIGREKENGKKNSPAFFAKKIDEFKNLNGKLEEAIHSAGEGLALKILHEYENELQKNNAFDFDDLIEKTVFVLQGHPAALKRWQRKFDALLVDEYQDLNPKQYELVRLLAGEHKNLSVVGDDEQLIYGWRHANIRTFLNFERDWPEAEIAYLEENYRSTQKIIKGAQAVAENNQYRRPKELWTKNEEGASIKIVEAEDEEQEAEWIAREIEERIMNSELSKGAKNPIIHNSSFIIPSTAVLYRTNAPAPKGRGSPNEIGRQSLPSIAILYRTNAQSRALEQALIRRQIPYKIFGGIRFYERKEVKDAVAALRWAWNPKDTISKERLEKNLSKTKFSGLEARLAAERKASPIQLIKAFLEATDYLDYIDRNFVNSDERRENIAELINFASQYQDLGQFLEEVALMQPTDRAEERIKNKELRAGEGGGGEKSFILNSKFLIPASPQVNLMTIHLSKGLEFDNVFIAGVSEGLLPHAMSMENKYQLEEERRLMYVAMTRAKKNLHISFYDIPSRFIGEIPEEIIKFSRAGTKEALDQEDADAEEFIYID